MNKKQPLRGFFDEQETLAKLSKLNDPLEKLDRHIDFEVFRETLKGGSKNSKSNGSRKGAKNAKD